MKIIKRRLVRGAWLYADRQEHSFAVAMMLYQVPLVLVDDLIEQSTGPHQMQLLKERAAALAAYSSGNIDSAKIMVQSLLRVCLLLAAGRRRRRIAVKNGTKGALPRKEAAHRWQTSSEALVTRMLQATPARSNRNIAALIAPDIARSEDSIRRFVAQVRATHKK